MTCLVVVTCGSCGYDVVMTIYYSPHLCQVVMLHTLHAANISYANAVISTVQVSLCNVSMLLGAACIYCFIMNLLYGVMLWKYRLAEKPAFGGLLYSGAQTTTLS